MNVFIAWTLTDIQSLLVQIRRIISQHEKQLLQLLNGVLHGTPIPQITVEEWEPLYKEMKDQCVSILPSDYMDEFPLNPEQAEVFWE